MNLPTRKDIANRRVNLFKEQIVATLEAEDLDFFEEMIDSFQSEYDVGHRRIAAALAYLVQKERPLQPEEGLVEPPPAAERSSDNRPPRPPREGDSKLLRYRIEVGRSHGVEPRHIVGAITNESQLTSKEIGAIKIYHDFCLVDLPRDLPSESFKHLQGVWVCGQQLKLSVDQGAGGGDERPSHRRAPGKGGPFKPGSKKSTHTRRGPHQG
jgi:ATP-dependent RNA helicase DeaD